MASESNVPEYIEIISAVDDTGFDWVLELTREQKLKLQTKIITTWEDMWD